MNTAKGLMSVWVPSRVLKIIRKAGRPSTKEALAAVEVGLLNPRIEKLQSEELKTKWRQGPLAFLLSLSCLPELRERVRNFADRFFEGEYGLEAAAGWLVVIGLGVDPYPPPHGIQDQDWGPVWKKEVRPYPPPPPPIQSRLLRVNQPVQGIKVGRSRIGRQIVRPEEVPTSQTLIELRLSTGFSQARAAREFGISRSYLAEIERGVRGSPWARKRISLFYSGKKVAQQNNG